MIVDAHADNAGAELVKLREALTDEQLTWALGLTAARVSGIDREATA